eukprot:TRINITY_DN14147_c0_g8_i2.p1 TRINITY_DN14147_c0_g8~~TRINITY_DN14147_c0_g8_i2.p1  ORF type:complete len:452 (+),score=77.89 TRINITY_DN14147_c0_g8_i2:149-1504(+)
MQHSSILLISLLCFAPLAVQETKPIYSIIIASSGVRNPEDSVAKWGVNRNELTALGIRQLYLLGRQMNKRYAKDFKLINETFNQKEVKFRSMYSGARSTPTSAYAFAAGLYKPGTGNILDTFQQKHAVPPTNFVNYAKYQNELKDAALIHRYTSVPIVMRKEVPNYSFEAIKTCPGIKDLMSEYYGRHGKKRQEMENSERKLKEMLYPAMKKALGLNKDIENFDEALKHREHVIAANYSSIKLAYTLTDEEYKLLDELYDTGLAKRLFNIVSIARLQSYGLASEVLNILYTITNATNPYKLKEKMTVYVLDDINLLAFLRIVGHTTPEKFVTVPYASSLTIDVGTHEEELRVVPTFNGEYVYWNLTKKSLPLIAFKNMLEAAMKIDFESICNFTLKKQPTSNLVLFIAISFAVTACLIIALIVVFCIRRMKRETTTETDDSPIFPCMKVKE